MPTLPDLALALAAALGLAAWIPGPGSWLVQRLALPPAFAVPLGFAAFATGAYGGFFLWYAAPWAGRSFALAWFAAGIALTAVRRRVWTLAALAPGLLALALGALWLGVLVAGGRPPEDRFLWTLPVDNRLPALFAQKLAGGESPTPLIGDWLSSDRPPLAAALHLALPPFGAVSPESFAAQTVGTLAQLLWLPALWVLGQAAALGRRPLSYALGAAATAGFFALNTLYTWPKLLAAGFVLAALAVALATTAEKTCAASPEVRRRRTGVVAALCALGLLAHGAVAFTLLALPCWPAAWRFARYVGAGALLAGALAGAAMLAPWSAYRAFVDPPGNRLAKWHLAGSPAIDQRGFWETLGAAWRARDAATFRATVGANVRTVAGVWQRPAGEPPAAWLRRIQFFHTLPALGLVALGWLAWLRPDPARRALGELAALAGAATALWAVLMFLPASTLLHQGSYASFALLFFVGAAGLGRLPSWAGAPLLAAHAALFGWAWIATTPPPAPPTSAPVLALAAAGLPLVATYWAAGGGSTRSTAARNAASA